MNGHIPGRLATRIAKMKGIQMDTASSKIDARPASPARRPVLPNLTGIRIFAAMYVLLYHLFGSPDPGRPWYDAWIDGGYLGVSLFFVLSGFILAYNAPAVGNAKKFYVLRLARVYPLYLAAMIWGLPNYFRHGTTPWAVLLPADLLLVQTWFGPNWATQINPPSWSLSTEAFFYLCFPLLLPPLRRALQSWPRVLAGLYVAAILPAVVTFLVLHAHGQQIRGLSEHLLDLPLFRVAEFSVGVLLGLLFAERQPRVSGRQTALAFAASFVAIGLSVGHVPFPIVRTGLLALPFGWLLYGLAGWKSRFLASAPMQLLGEISYGVYLLQIPLLMTIGRLIRNRPGITSALELLLIIPVAYLFYVVVEKPGRRMILAMFGVRSHAKPIETPQKSLA